jgi:hypothetical protein
MGTWNIRVIVTEEPVIGGDNELDFALHEVYYTKGKPSGLTKRPIRVSGESIEALQWYIDKMQEALKKPILWGDHRWSQEYKREEQ